MSKWSVRVTLAPPAGVSAPEDVLDTLTSELADHGAAVALEYSGHVSIQLTVEAGTRRSAFDQGDRAVSTAAAAVGVGEYDVVEVQVLTWAEFERQLGEPAVPPLVGVSEAAELLGVSRPRIDQLFDLYPDELPLVTKLAGKQGARIWLRSTWVRFAGKERRRGRPAKKPAALDQADASR